MSTEGQCSASHGLEQDETCLSLPVCGRCILWPWSSFWALNPIPRLPWGPEHRVDHHRPGTNVFDGKGWGPGEGLPRPAVVATSHLTNVCGRVCFNDVSCVPLSPCVCESKMGRRKDHVACHVVCILGAQTCNVGAAATWSSPRGVRGGGSSDSLEGTAFVVTQSGPGSEGRGTAEACGGT